MTQKLRLFSSQQSLGSDIWCLCVILDWKLNCKVKLCRCFACNKCIGKLWPKIARWIYVKVIQYSLWLVWYSAAPMRPNAKEKGSLPYKVQLSWVLVIIRGSELDTFQLVTPPLVTVKKSSKKTGSYNYERKDENRKSAAGFLRFVLPSW